LQNMQETDKLLPFSYSVRFSLGDTNKNTTI
jgi:hypothetical protein